MAEALARPRVIPQGSSYLLQKMVRDSRRASTGWMHQIKERDVSHFAAGRIEFGSISQEIGTQTLSIWSNSEGWWHDAGPV